MPHSLSNQISSPNEAVDDIKATFVRNVNHELRTPVAIILGYADMLNKGMLGEMEDQQQEAVYVIADQATELRNLVERVSILMGYETNSFKPAPVSLEHIIARLTDTYRNKINKAELTLNLRLKSDLPLVAGLSHDLEEALNCLLENAIKFTAPGGQIYLNSNADDQWVYISITDTGIGIPKDKLAHIFDSFYQIDGSPTRHYGGLGLGLTIAKTVVERHQGEIEVISRPGHGSRFTVKLPVPSPEGQLDSPNLSSARVQRILVVDDEKNVTLMLRETLQQLPDCEIMMAANGEQALRLFKKQPFDMLITDYNMPGMDGLSLAAQIHNAYPKTSVIVLTGYANDVLRERAAGLSVKKVLDKPVKLKEIRQVVSDTLLADRNHK